MIIRTLMMTIVRVVSHHHQCSSNNQNGELLTMVNKRRKVNQIKERDSEGKNKNKRLWTSSIVITLNHKIVLGTK